MIRITRSQGVIIAGDHAGGITQTLSVSRSALLSDLDMIMLAAQLRNLRAAMKRRAESADHDLAVAEIARAETAAVAGDRAGVAARLRDAGAWALGIAKEILLPLAVDAIERSIHG